MDVRTWKRVTTYNGEWKTAVRDYVTNFQFMYLFQTHINKWVLRVCIATHQVVERKLKTNCAIIMFLYFYFLLYY